MKRPSFINKKKGVVAGPDALQTPTRLGGDAVRDLTDSMTTLLADIFAIYVKTKNFHWHVAGHHFPGYHVMFDGQAEQIYAVADPLAERIRKIGGTAIHSISQIASLQRAKDNNEEFVDAMDMVEELGQDNLDLTGWMKETHDLCLKYGDVPTSALLEVWMDEAERRVWFLFETSRKGATDGDAKGNGS